MKRNKKDVIAGALMRELWYSWQHMILNRSPMRTLSCG